MHVIHIHYNIVHYSAGVSLQFVLFEDAGVSGSLQKSLAEVSRSWSICSSYFFWPPFTCGCWLFMCFMLSHILFESVMYSCLMYSVADWLQPPKSVSLQRLNLLCETDQKSQNSLYDLDVTKHTAFFVSFNRSDITLMFLFWFSL